MTDVQVPAPAGSHMAQSSGVDKDALISRLDTLLEQYLHTLDEYEALTQQLSKDLSSAFFSLAQANFHNRSGVYYGQDQYDERVQATRRIVVTEDQECKLRFTTTSTNPTPTPTSTPTEPNSPPTTKTTQPPNAETSTEDEKNLNTDANSAPRPSSATEENTTPKAAPADPLRMFGILVPPALRSAQSSFAQAVQGPVVRLAGVAGELRALEREVGRVRKGIRRA